MPFMGCSRLYKIGLPMDKSFTIRRFIYNARVKIKSPSQDQPAGSGPPLLPIKKVFNMQL